MPERPADQRNVPFPEPPRDAIPGITRAQLAEMESSAADGAWFGSNMQRLILRTVGRRSGREHKVVLPYWIDEGGRRVVVGSFAGAPAHPAWYLNLADRTANPEVLVHVQHGRYWSVPEVPDGDAHAALWASLVQDRPFYADYQRRCERRIPLVVLPETRPLAPDAPLP